MTKEVKGSPFIQYLAAASATLGIVTDGMHYGWSSPSLIQLTNNETCQNIFCITSSEGYWLAVMPLIGAIFGSLCATQIVDNFGRKVTILGTAIPFFLAWMLIAAAQSIGYLYSARLIAGLADGVTFTVVPMYIGEIADPQVRGLLGSSCSVTWIAGFLIINVIGSYLSITTTALISSILPAILFLTFLAMPESPYYLLMKGRTEAARKVLQRLKRVDDVSTDIHRITTAMEESRTDTTVKFFDLFKVKGNRKALIIILGLRGFQQLSGTTAIAFYTHEIFQTAGGIDLAHGVIIYYSVQLLMTIISSSIVDRAGRKPLMIISMAGSTVSLFLLGTYFYMALRTSIDTSSFSFVFIMGILGFVILFGLGMQSIPICMLGELFPTSVKAYALCIADVYFSVMASLASKYLQFTKDHYGLDVSFYGFTVSSIIGLLFIIFVVPETKGKTLEEIQYYLQGTKQHQPNDDEEERPIKV